MPIHANFRSTGGVLAGMGERSSNFYSGTSGLVLPVPNKSAYPPEFQAGSRLNYYGYLFSSLEVNSSFYKIPQAGTISKWAEAVPESFRFTFKLWREITHVKELLFNPDDVHRFMKVIAAAGPKKGCLLIQFPPSLDLSAMRQVERLLVTLEEADPGHEWQPALEFRKPYWYHEEVSEILSGYGVIPVLHDKAGSASGFSEPESNSVYLRFHGPGGDYRGSYGDEFLYEYAQYINGWLGEGRTVYAYFNNTMGDASRNLMTLNSFVNSV